MLTTYPTWKTNLESWKQEYRRKENAFAGIQAFKQPDEVPTDFSFKIQDNPGERTIMLEKEFQGEIITVQVDLPTLPEEDENEEPEPEEDRDEDDEEEPATASLPLVVSITKGDAVSLEFGITAYMEDDFTIDRLSVKRPEISDDELAYEGPDFDDLDEKLQKALYNYLEVRGINSATTNYLLSYMINKEEREHLQWLEGIKKFVAK